MKRSSRVVTRPALAAAAIVLTLGTGAVRAQGAPPAMPRPLERIFSGHWRIVGVAVTGGPVQALVADDPAYLHRTLTFSADRLAWDEPANTTEAACLAPTFTHHSAEPDPEQALQLRGLQIHHPVAYTVRCRSGDWGPAGADDPTFFVSDGGSLALPWYDGGMLKLMRAK